MSNVEEVKSGKAKRREKKLKNEPQSVTADEVPESLQLLDFCEARAKELSGMMTALQRKGGSKRTFQKLPRHMRRRATSHNIKRLPWRLRDQAITEVRMAIWRIASFNTTTVLASSQFCCISSIYKSYHILQARIRGGWTYIILHHWNLISTTTPHSIYIVCSLTHQVPVFNPRSIS